ncbi:MAG TPA: MarR family EPS-associated transcriptional regulator [Burkholderiaceae bacterium]|nr:MarR family EPS-associated transcriptional regulator [Burkholderiaceae bacterium]
MIEHHLASEPPHAPDSPAHLALLRLLDEHPDYSQRQMAIALGVSVGKTHYVLKALLAKGWVKALKFQRGPNKLGYIYRLTPNGLSHRLQLTKRFLAVKEQEYVALKGEIAALRGELETRDSASAAAARDSI